MAQGAPTDSSVYYRDRYWNDLDEVRRHLNQLVTGEPEKRWYEYLQDRLDGRVFERALMLNCGNGWVERELVDAGVVTEAVGIDILDDLLEQARTEAGDRELRYEQCDTNVAAFPEGPFDLVVNHSAAHHIRNLDRVFRAIAELLPDDGWFVNWDYVGPHRNQYPYEQWSAAWELLQSLPEDLRSEMEYPYLPAMLASDPTEAVHSELILDTFERYFTTDEMVELGGGLAYLVLTHNPAFLDAPEEQRVALTAEIIEQDMAWTRARSRASLFAWFAGRPDRMVLADTDQLARWTAEEDEREAAAQANSDRYYPETALQSLVEELAEARRIQQERALVEDSACWRARQRLKASPLGDLVRKVANPLRQRLHVRQARRHRTGD